MSTDAIRRYYRQYDEWARLGSPAGQLELHRCLEILDEHLEADSRVLDLGGGPGRYTVELARRGHRVTLVDLMDEHVERAERELADRGLLERLFSTVGFHTDDVMSARGIAAGREDKLLRIRDRAPNSMRHFVNSSTRPPATPP